MIRLFPLLVVACLALAGCIEMPADPNAPGATRSTNSGGAMTARATQEDSVAPCSGGLGLPRSGAFCATRVVTITGTIDDLPRLDVSLTTFNGAIDVGTGDEGQWSVVATLEARSATAEGAKANLDNVELAWSHEERGSHFLDVEARQKVQAQAGDGYAASLDVTMPRSLVMTLVATTSNGVIDVDGALTDGLALQTSNGQIKARASVTQVSLATSNGAIDADLTPTGSGRMTMATSNGAISVTVPEGPRHGYDIEGRTSNGEIDYDLRDGESGGCPGGSQYYTPPCTARDFRTHGFAERDIQSRMSLSTSNGAISVRAT